MGIFVFWSSEKRCRRIYYNGESAGRENERDERVENEIKVRKVFPFIFFFFFCFLLTSKTPGSRSGNRNSFKTTLYIYYFRAIKFFEKDKNY